MSSSTIGQRRHLDVPTGRRPAMLALAALALAACSGAQTEPTDPARPVSATDPAAAAGSYNGVVRTDPLQVGAFALTDVTDPDLRAGGRVDAGVLAFKAAPGRVLVPYFGFTSCPDVCPTTFADLRVALREMPSDLADRVDVAFVTIDERRDTPEALNGYLSSFFERFHVVRADEAETRSVAEGFLASFSITGSGTDTEVAHTATLYAVDETGAVRVEWPFGTRGVDIAADLERLFATIDGEPTSIGGDADA